MARVCVSLVYRIRFLLLQWQKFPLNIRRFLSRRCDPRPDECERLAGYPARLLILCTQTIDRGLGRGSPASTRGSGSTRTSLVLNRR